jgi:hypothetical protein
LKLKNASTITVHAVSGEEAGEDQAGRSPTEMPNVLLFFKGTKQLTIIHSLVPILFFPTEQLPP